MAAPFRITLQPASRGSCRYASLRYSLIDYLYEDDGLVEKLKALARKHHLQDLHTISTNNPRDQLLAALAAFEADLVLLLHLPSIDGDLSLWIRCECLHLTDLAARLETQGPSAPERRFLNSLAGPNIGLIMRVMSDVTLINSQD